MASQTSTTTTTNQHWQLEKVSRSRVPVEAPAKRAKLGGGEEGGKGGQAAMDAEIEWDHYTQPQLSLRLKTTFAASHSGSSSTGGGVHHVQSMTLSVSFDPLYREPNRAKQHITLDLLDLVSFSSPAIRAATPKDQLPLKAVYKDAVLGLRYISLEGHEPQFKRLQVKFLSQEERERFVEAVGALVPSKPAVEPVKPKSKAGSKAPTPRKKKQDAPSQQPFQQPPSSAMLTSDHPMSSASPFKLPSASRQSLPPVILPPLPPIPATPRGQARPAASSPAKPVSTPRVSLAAHTRSLPRHLTTLLPNLASSTQPFPPASPASPTLTPAQQLQKLTPVEFDELLQEVLLEEGFEELLARVQATLTG
ncbi:hypothetical protein JCM10213_004213 [Rhodosporidiobolus nylandii]